MTDTTNTDFDAIVVGTGFAGIYMLHKLRNELGLRTRAFDRAGGVGGTWYWNRYPGAMSDVEGFVYRYSFDKQMLQEWNWTTNYTPQRELLAYLEAVVAKHDLGRDIQLNTGIVSAVFDESRGSGPSAPTQVRASPHGTSSPRSGRCRRRTSPRSRAATASRAGSSTPAPGPTT
ncbi:hypothetical protein GCM10027612_35000 [Microbispora bryophytorum subsp. camponoti]